MCVSVSILNSEDEDPAKLAHCLTISLSSVSRNWYLKHWTPLHWTSSLNAAVETGLLQCRNTHLWPKHCRNYILAILPHKELLFQPAICYLSFRWVIISHAWTLNCMDNWSRTQNTFQQSACPPCLTFPHLRHKQAVWHFWFRWVILAFLTGCVFINLWYR